VVIGGLKDIKALVAVAELGVSEHAKANPLAVSDAPVVRDRTRARFTITDDGARLNLKVEAFNAQSSDGAFEIRELGIGKSRETQEIPVSTSLRPLLGSVEDSFLQRGLAEAENLRSIIAHDASAGDEL